jgi:hypothetical protein
MLHRKYDLYTDEQLAALQTKVGDILDLEVPTSRLGEIVRGRHKVLALEKRDIGEFEGKHYTQIELQLEGPL